MLRLSARRRVIIVGSSIVGGVGAAWRRQFGLHLVNVSAHWTTGGKSVAEVEALVDAKLGDLDSFDAWLDFRVTLVAADLDSCVTSPPRDRTLRCCVGRFSFGLRRVRMASALASAAE